MVDTGLGFPEGDFFQNGDHERETVKPPTNGGPGTLESPDREKPLANPFIRPLERPKNYFFVSPLPLNFGR